MGLFIRDDTVRDMARRLAEARRTTVTEAVRQALEHELADMEQNGGPASGASMPRLLGWMRCRGET